MPALSKTDSKGEGVLRKLGCLCEHHPNLCPVAAAKRLLQAATENGNVEDDPLIVTDKPKKTPTKQGMVKAFRRVAVALGLTEEEAQEITGHILRPMGAQLMARKGIEFYKIQLFCRWGSDVILKYLREVPLENSDQWLDLLVLWRDFDPLCKGPGDAEWASEVDEDGKGNPERVGDAEHTSSPRSQPDQARDRQDLGRAEGEVVGHE